jgi:hypothetical protein
MVYIGSGNTGPTRLVDDSSGMQLHIGPTSGSVLLSDFGQDLTHGVIDLIGGVGGFTTTAAVLAALTPDGSGGTQLSLGNGNHLDIQGVLPSALTATNFKIG